MKPQFSSIPFFVYPVRDMARAKAFYGGLLGLHEGHQWEDKWTEYEVGATTLALSAVMENAQPGAKAGAVALETDQFEDAVAYLKGKGVKFALEPVDTGVCKFARFEDPDGNPLVLHKKPQLPPG